MSNFFKFKMPKRKRSNLIILSGRKSLEAVCCGKFCNPVVSILSLPEEHPEKWVVIDIANKLNDARVELCETAKNGNSVWKATTEAEVSQAAAQVNSHLTNFINNLNDANSLINNWHQVAEANNLFNTNDTNLNAADLNEVKQSMIDNNLPMDLLSGCWDKTVQILNEGNGTEVFLNLEQNLISTIHTLASNLQQQFNILIETEIKFRRDQITLTDVWNTRFGIMKSFDSIWANLSAFDGFMKVTEEMQRIAAGYGG